MSQTFDNLKQAGAFIGSWHPVQTFNTCFSEPEIWKQIICTYQGDPEIVNSLKNLTENLGAEFLEVNMYQKKSIHLSAVIAANYQVGLMALACDILEQAEIGDKTGKKLLYPLIRQVLDNFYNFPVHSILTGPLVRGDIESISDHLRILENSSNPESIQLYKSMARHIINDSKFKIPETKNLKHLLEQ